MFATRGIFFEFLQQAREAFGKYFRKASGMNTSVLTCCVLVIWCIQARQPPITDCEGIVFPPSFTKALSSAANIVHDPTLEPALQAGLCFVERRGLFHRVVQKLSKQAECSSANLGAQVAELLLLVVHHPLQLRLALLGLPVVLVVKPGQLSLHHLPHHFRHRHHDQYVELLYLDVRLRTEEDPD